MARVLLVEKREIKREEIFKEKRENICVFISKVAARPLEPLGSAAALHPRKLDYRLCFMG